MYRYGAFIEKSGTCYNFFQMCHGTVISLVIPFFTCYHAFRLSPPDSASLYIEKVEARKHDLYALTKGAFLYFIHYFLRRN